MTPRDYKVLEAASAEELARKVQQASYRGGYELQGGVTTATDKDGRTIYRQAMVLLILLLLAGCATFERAMCRGVMCPPAPSADAEMRPNDKLSGAATGN